MKRSLLLFILCGLSLSAFSQTSVLKESLSVKSSILGKDVHYSIYFPADYDKGNRRYPVLYLLHGYSDDETGWTQFGEAQSIADKMEVGGETTPMIIVMPDGGVSYYINSADGKTNYEDFLTKEFIPSIDAAYRTRTKREYRAVAGLSMGGYGTLILALKHPDLFAAAAALSAAVRTDQEILDMPMTNWNNTMANLYGSMNVEGKGRLSDAWYKNSILKLVETTPVDSLKKVRYYIDCGDDDFLIKGNMALHAAMIDKKVPHEFRVRDGAHNWTYWRTALPEVLKFISVSFHR